MHVECAECACAPNACAECANRELTRFMSNAPNARVRQTCAPNAPIASSGNACRMRQMSVCAKRVRPMRQWRIGAFHVECAKCACAPNVCAECANGEFGQCMSKAPVARVGQTCAPNAPERQDAPKIHARRAQEKSRQHPKCLKGAFIVNAHWAHRCISNALRMHSLAGVEGGEVMGQPPGGRYLGLFQYPPPEAHH